jgi:hypothetical protein
MTSTAAYADSFGYIGINLSSSSAIDEASTTVYTSTSYGLDGAYAFQLANGAAVVVDALIHSDDFDPNPFYGGLSEPQYQVSVNYLHPMSGGLTLNGFAGYGVAPFDETDEVYQIGFIGAGAVYDTSSTMSIFGQLGYGTSVIPTLWTVPGFTTDILFVQA